MNEPTTRKPETARTNDPRSAGRDDAPRLRAAEGLPTPAADPLVLRELARLLDLAAKPSAR